MPRSHGRRRRRGAGRQFEQKAAARPTEQPPIQKAASPTAASQTAGAQRPSQSAGSQRATQELGASLSHVKRDIITVGVVTTICIVLLVVLWAVLR